MASNLGDALRKKRDELHLSLRDVERETGIHNAHLSQIENGVIEKPAPNILWTLSQLYGLNFQHLFHLAGHTNQDDSVTVGDLAGVAFRALKDLSADEQREVMDYIERITKGRGAKERRPE